MKKRATGQRDCNGREIYEGDIVEIRGMRGPVTYDERMGMFYYGFLAYDVMNEETRNSIKIVGCVTCDEDHVIRLE